MDLARQIRLQVLWFLLVAFACLPSPLWSQTATTTASAEAGELSAKQIVELYRELRSVGLDPAHVYTIREAVIDREDLHIFLTDGTVAFTRAVDGRITGAYFAGEGEVLLRPPDAGERASLGLFTGLGVLDEHFSTAYFRFNDSTAQELAPMLRASEDPAGFAAAHEQEARSLSEADALRLTQSFTSRFPDDAAHRDRYLHARLGTRLGVFSVYYDSLAEDQLLVGRVNSSGPETYYDLWMSFPGRPARTSVARRVIDPWRSASAVHIESTHIDARAIPPESLQASAELKLKVNDGGQRMLTFILSRALRVDEVTHDGEKLAWLQNESLEGSETARVGNDLVTVILQRVLQEGEDVTLRFAYRGNVMHEVAPGLVSVGSRGNWYPNRGLDLSRFDLMFHWPRGWTLTATGRPMSISDHGDESAGTWRSDTVIPFAGFNIGKYERQVAHAGPVEVEALAASAVEGEWHAAAAVPPQVPGLPQNTAIANERPATPDASLRGRHVAEHAAETIDQYARWFGPYPFSKLSLTQFPGNMSQSWATLVFLSSLGFLPPEDKSHLGLTTFQSVIVGDFMADHETAHQWWGDLVFWQSYRDQWLLEALANYSAWMLLERRNPDEAKLVLEEYRRQLSTRNSAGRRLSDAGPVSLGMRLSSSVFPEGYPTIAYGRGTWLIHMLRELFRDASLAAGENTQPDARFLAALRAFRERCEHRTATTRDFRRVLEEFLPAKGAYEGRRSLAWFFSGWVDGADVPRLSLANVKMLHQSGKVVANFVVQQQDASLDLVTSVPVYGAKDDGQMVFIARIFADGPSTRLRLPVPPGIRKLVLDPRGTVLTAP